MPLSHRQVPVGRDCTATAGVRSLLPSPPGWPPPNWKLAWTDSGRSHGHRQGLGSSLHGGSWLCWACVASIRRRWEVSGRAGQESGTALPYPGNPWTDARERPPEAAGKQQHCAAYFYIYLSETQSEVKLQFV